MEEVKARAKSYLDFVDRLGDCIDCFISAGERIEDGFGGTSSSVFKLYKLSVDQRQKGITYEWQDICWSILNRMCQLVVVEADVPKVNFANVLLQKKIPAKHVPVLA